MAHTPSSPLPANVPTSALDAVKDLISLDTTSDSGNIEAIELLKSWCDSAGVQTHVFRESDGINANIVAVFPAKGDEPRQSTDQLSKDVLGAEYHTGFGGLDLLDGPKERAAGSVEARGVLIAGHVDCVPVTGQQWDTDPFTPTISEGRLYGRGASDMKSYLGIFASLMGKFAAAKLSEPVYFAATWEEETTCNGARELVKQLAYLGIAPRVAFVGEPTMMNVITAHKSMNLFEAEFRGIAAHSSLLPRGLNAIRYASEFATWYTEDIIDRGASEGPRDPAFTVEHLTGGVNQFEGGIASNTVPSRAYLHCEFRALPGTDVAAIAREIQAKIDQIDATMKEHVPADPADPVEAQNVGATLTIRSLLYPLDAGEHGPAVSLAAECGASVSPVKVSYGTETGIYEAAGMSAVVIGPGDIAQAHGANEYVDLEQVAACEKFFLALLEKLSQ